MAEPIEITAKDLIDRPANLSLGGTADKGGGFNPAQLMKTIKENMQIFKELRELAESLGLNLNLPGLKMVSRKEADTALKDMPEPPNPAKQFNAFLVVLQMKYGDVTVNELLNSLRTDFGNKKLSQMRLQLK